MAMLLNIWRIAGGSVAILLTLNNKALRLNAATDDIQLSPMTAKEEKCSSIRRGDPPGYPPDIQRMVYGFCLLLFLQSHNSWRAISARISGCQADKEDNRRP